MANIKSAKKRIITAKKNADLNKSKKSLMKTVLKNTNAAIDEGNKELTKVFSTIDKSSAKGLIHKNKAARMKSQLAKKVNAI